MANRTSSKLLLHPVRQREVRRGGITGQPAAGGTSVRYEWPASAGELGGSCSTCCCMLLGVDGGGGRGGVGGCAFDLKLSHEVQA